MQCTKYYIDNKTVNECHNIHIDIIDIKFKNNIKTQTDCTAVYIAVSVVLLFFIYQLFHENNSDDVLIYMH